MCSDCGRNFIFHSDVEEHKRNFRHTKMTLRGLSSSGVPPAMFIRGRMSLGFRLNGSVSRIVVEYEYYPSSGAINYVDVRYTDTRLQSMVEGDPKMMKNIDGYLRRRLQDQTARV
jgi:hypothetical protein